MLKMVNDKKDDGRWYPFRVIIGLVEGYEANATRHTLTEVKKLIGNWLEACRVIGLPELPGMIDERTMLYIRRGDGRLIEEPVAVFEGEVNPLRIPADVTEEGLLSALWGLAGLLAANLHQTRIYIKFNNRMVVLEYQ